VGPDLNAAFPGRYSAQNDLPRQRCEDPAAIELMQGFMQDRLQAEARALARALVKETAVVRKAEPSLTVGLPLG
jgi:hypothetical protein